MFLRSWRSTVIAGLSIPLSVVGALIILWSRGESLNMLTLGGLTIAIGRVIDDSIVVIENIYRHLQEGDSIRRAAYTGTREVAGAITASTLTTVAVFLPLGLRPRARLRVLPAVRPHRDVRAALPASSSP